MRNTIQVYGKKKNSTAIALVKGPGKGIIKVNGIPIDLLQPETLKIKVFEPFFILRSDTFTDIDIRIKVKGGGHVSQLYAIRQAIARGIIRYAEKYVGEETKIKFKNLLLNYDRSLLVKDSRNVEPKKYGGKGARARYQKSYR
ncbi:40S ribosomal protein S16 (nucleomorph) [Guillardia theta]|uniref:40S ribosomal protein S16 n=1 Tax=Guillardia theta TaxID=55529 RepID=Q98S19_GUITH|nr:40S ribosomal protein S16 [Guillardia theta]AAK39784.1 40S ribosomal protein S16 [Guillardia theta]|mmetsp:Transcript_20548/g.68876  ORF Transcript_20548/g.68876 Transcript_20548/m.68876 type:complete len:143 (-) Transcript_20548:4763-5191(-)